MRKPGIHAASAEEIAQRFWAKVKRGAPQKCWPYLGKTFAGLQPYRVAFQLAKGPIPQGQLVMHSCDNPPCCNPRHLDLGTTAENMADKMRKGRHRGNGWENKTHCKHGHEFTDENTLRTDDGHRRCRTCIREIKRKYQARVRAKLGLIAGSHVPHSR